MMENFVIIGAKIPLKEREFLDDVVEDDVQWATRGHLIRAIIHYWVEDKKAKNTQDQGQEQEALPVEG